MEFTVKTTIPASPSQIYFAWLDSKGHSDMTGGEAHTSNKVGENFTAWDDYISGTNIELEKDLRILQSWRTTQFIDGEEDSQIEVSLKETKDGTMLTLIHSSLPETGDHYREGWNTHYFQPMTAYFSDLK